MPSKSDDLKQKIDVVKKYIENPSRLYTGLEVKKYWRSNVFDAQSQINSAVKSGRWSSYGHYSLLLSFKNILTKHELKKNAHVWIHPLTEKSIVEHVIDSQYQISSLDINRETLQFDVTKFQNMVEDSIENHTKPELVILSSYTGLGKEIEKIIAVLNHFNIPCCIIFDELSITKTILEVISLIKYGSVLMKRQNEPFTTQLFDVIKQTELTPEEKNNIPHYDYLINFLSGNKLFYLSFFIEDRATSILEYHLSDSKNKFESILKVYYFLLTKNKVSSSTILQNTLDSFLSFTDGKIKFGSIFKNHLFKNKVEAINSLISNLPHYLNSAIPDCVFEIDNLKEVSKQDNHLNDLASDLQQNTKNIHTFFSRQVEKRPKGTLEIPVYYFNRVYVRYFCYSTEGKYWMDVFNSRNIPCKYGFDIHPLFAGKDYLGNANFVASFGLLV